MNLLDSQKVINICKLSRENKYTRREIAEKVGVSSKTVYNYQKKFNLL
jgi:transposase